MDSREYVACRRTVKKKGITKKMAAPWALSRARKDQLASRPGKKAGSGQIAKQ
jgi:hypothetical protein